MGLRSRLGWMVNGHTNTASALEVLSADLRALQQRVDALQAGVERSLRAVEVDTRELRERQLAEFDSVRAAVGAATDDLGARIAALHVAAANAAAAHVPTGGAP